MHEVPEAQLTPFRALKRPVRFPVRWIVHLWPSQRSANVFPVFPLPLRETPTAKQDLTEVHETPSNLLSLGCEGLGACWSDQLTPFQRSTVTALPVRSKDQPTAMHIHADTHDTA
jgi:hypothetical protein